MGEMADMFLDQVIDHEDEVFDYLHGGMSPLEAFDRGIIDATGHLPTSGINKRKGILMPTPKRRSTKKKTSKKRTKSRAGTTPSGPGFLGKLPISMFLFGPPGVGKTDLAAHFPKPGFIIDPQEEGIKTLAEFKRCPKPQFIETADNFETTLDLCDSIAAGDYDIQTAVFDSSTGFEKLCFHYHCEEYFEGDWSDKGFYSFFKGPKNAAKTDWSRFIDALDRVRQSGVNVVMIGHSVVKNYSNPDGPDYERFVPYLDKETWQQTHRWAKGVIFYNYHVDVDTKGLKAKARPESEARYLYTEWSPAFDAKNQWGLEPVIDAGSSGKEAFNAFAKAFKKAAA